MDQSHHKRRQIDLKFYPPYFPINEANNRDWDTACSYRALDRMILLATESNTDIYNNIQVNPQLKFTIFPIYSSIFRHLHKHHCFSQINHEQTIMRIKHANQLKSMNSPYLDIIEPPSWVYPERIQNLTNNLHTPTKIRHPLYSKQTRIGDPELKRFELFCGKWIEIAIGEGKRSVPGRRIWRRRLPCRRHRSVELGRDGKTEEPRESWWGREV